MLSTAVVHTTGINWGSILAITVSVTAVLGTVIGFVVKAADRRAKTFSDDLGAAISRGLETFRKEYFDPMNLRLARIEGRLMGQDQREKERE